MRNLFAGLTLSVTMLWAAPPQSTSLPTYWRYAYPEARFLLGVDLASIGNSQFGQRLKKEFRNAGFTAAAGKQGMDFIWSADRLLLSSSGIPASGKGSNKTPAVAALQGKFDLPGIRKEIQSKGAVRSSYKGLEMWVADKDGSPIAMALVSPQVLLLGDRAGVRAAIDNHADANPSDSTSAIYQRAVALAADNDLWFVSEAALDSLDTGGLDGPNLPGSEMFKDVEGFEGGVTFRNGLGLNLHLRAKSEDGAKSLRSGLQTMLSLFTMGTAKEKGGSDLLNKLQVGIEGNQVNVALHFTQKDLDRGLQQFKAGVEGKIKRSLGGPVASINVKPTVRGAANWTLESKPVSLDEPEPAPQPNQPLVVKIFNADGGTKELNINKRP